MEVKKAFLKKVVPTSTDGEDGKVTFLLGNGVKVVAERDKIPGEVWDRLAFHGLSQKVGDAASGFSAARDFHSAFGAMQTVVDNLYAGIWAAKGGEGTSDLIAALCKIQGADEDSVRAALERANDEEFKAITAHPLVKREIAAIKAARAKEAAKAADKEGLAELFGKLVKE